MRGDSSDDDSSDDEDDIVSVEETVPVATGTGGGGLVGNGGVAAAASVATERGSIHEWRGDAFHALEVDTAFVQCIAQDRRMGRGVARITRRKWGRPTGVVPAVGGVMMQRRSTDGGLGCNLITKALSRGKPTLAAIEASLVAATAELVAAGVRRVRMPRIACGLDRKTWRDIRPLVLRTLVAAGMRVDVVALDGPVGLPSWSPLEVAVEAESSEDLESSDRDPSGSDGSGTDGDSEPAGGPAADAVGEVTPSLRERLRGAVLDAEVRAGRGGVGARLAVEVAAHSLCRTMRAARRALVETGARFKLKEVKVRNTVAPPSAEAAMTLLFGAAAAEAALQTKPLPDEPPGVEDEAVTVDLDGARVPPASAPRLPQTTAAWHRERVRQEQAGFQPNTHTPLRWKETPPTARPGHVLEWGQRMRVDDSPFLCTLLGKEVRQGCVEIVGWGDVDVVTPVFVVLHPVTLKPRLVHDLRAVNVLLHTTSVRYDRALEALDGSSVAGKLDILSAFRHCLVPEQDRRRLAFVVGEMVFRWRVLPFGASQSPELFGKELARVVSALRRRGVRCVVYVDDILVLADTPAALDTSFAALMDALAEAGWHIALDKTYVYAMTVTPFLGVLVDLDLQCLRVSVSKAEKLRNLCVAMLAHRTVSLRALQKVGGLLAFLGTATPDAKFCRLGIDRATAEAERLPGRTVGVKGQMLDDLSFWRDEAVHLPARTPARPGGETVAVCTDAAGAPARGYGAVCWPGRCTTPDLEGLLNARVDDVSADTMAVFGPLPHLVLESSASLETMALLRTLRRLLQLRPGWVRGRTIYWYSDSQAAVGAVAAWRSRAAGLSQQVRELFLFLRSVEAVVVPHWVARHLSWMPAADWLSRLWWRQAAAEWSLPPEVVQKLVAGLSWVPSVDVFAVGGNQQFASYATRFPTPGAQCDAFAAGWSGMRGWAYPPFSQISRVWRHAMVAVDARLCVVVPAGTPVPGVLRVVSRVPVPACALIDPRGHSPDEAFPMPLEAVEIWSPGVP